jgi:hypothetical protein
MEETNCQPRPQPVSWLAREMLTEPTLVRRAQQVYQEHGGGDDGYLAVRRFLDVELRLMTSWPRTEDYQGLASDYASIGLAQIGDLLSGAATAGQLLAQADTRWRQRYAERPGTFRQQHARQFLRVGLISTDPAGPYPGIDGAAYHPGVLDEDKGVPAIPAVLIRTRAMTEMITGWASYQEMAAWIASRGTTGSGELAALGAAARARCVQEELVLAYMLGDPASIPVISSGLAPTAFTSDTRYDLYAAILAVADREQRCDRDSAAAELTRRAVWIPRHALGAYGGPDLPWAHAYLHRLDATPVTRDTARRAVAALREEDHTAAAHAKSSAVPGPRRVIPASPERGTRATPAPENGSPQIQRPAAPTQPAAPAPRR